MWGTAVRRRMHNSRIERGSGHSVGLTSGRRLGLFRQYVMSGLVGLTVALALSGCATSSTLKQADGLMARGRYTEALALYRQEQAAHPKSRAVQDGLAAAKRKESERLAGMAAIRLEANDPARAFELFADATRYNPENQVAVDGLARSRDLWMERARALEQKERPQEALSVYERILREYRGYEPCLESIRGIQQSGANRHRTAAAQYVQQHQPGNAVIELLKARRLFTELPGIDTDLQEAVALTRAQAALDVAVFARAKSAMLGPPWAAYLSQRFASRQDPVTVLAGPAERTIRIELFGTFSKTTRKTEKSVATLEVPAGFSSRPNPEYDEMKVKVDAALARVRTLEIPFRDAQLLLDAMIEERKREGGTARPDEEAQRKRVAEAARPHKVAMEEYQRLSQQLAPLPPAFQVPVTRKVQYPIQLTTATLAVTGEVVLSDRTGKVIEVVPVRETLSVSDPSHPLLKAAPDRPELPADPVTLPDDTALKAQLETRVMEKLAVKVEAEIQRVLAARWSDARRLAVAGKVDAATEMFLMAWMADPRQAPDEALRYILETRQALGLPLLDTLRPGGTSTSQALRQDGAMLGSRVP